MVLADTVDRESLLKPKIQGSNDFITTLIYS